MNAGRCAVGFDLAAFVDDELRGARVLEVLDHLDRCESCSEEVAAIRALGAAIRVETPAESVPDELEGMASTVISRTRAEAAESWHGVFRRAQEDLHWVVVGVGAVAATFVSTLLLSAILAFGPKPDRADSLSALIANVRLPAGTLFLWATPVGVDQDPVLMQFDEGGVAVPRAMVEYAMLPTDWPRTEAALVDALQAVVTDDGHTVAFDRMDPQRRRQAEVLLEEISRLRAAGPLPYGVALAVHEVRLIASARVTVKGL